MLLSRSTRSSSSACFCVEISSTTPTANPDVSPPSASQELAQDIAQAVIGLQFQDAVNQRIAHVVEALQEMAGSLTTASQSHPEELASHLASMTWLEQMQQRYSMEAEHRVQEKQREESVVSSLGDNVELF